MSSSAPALDKQLRRFAGKVAERIDDTVAALQLIAHDAKLSGDAEPKAISYFVDATYRLLEQRDEDDVLAGAGYAVDAQAQRCAPAMIWWVRRGGALVERSHSVDPDADSFYDYASLRWFKAAKLDRRPTLSGPFIDTWGSDDYTVSVSVPVEVGSESWGILAADVDVRRFIDTLAADLREMRAPVALVNEADRVVVSTIPSLSTGLPILARGLRHDQSVERRRYDVSTYGWSVVVLAD
ncbi:hypothetical protein BH11ACT6_BH11ACT6_26310 [soil metagenome]